MRGRLIATAATAAALALTPAATASAAYPVPIIQCTLTVTITPVGIAFSLTCTGLIPFELTNLTITSRNPATPSSAIQIAGTQSLSRAVAADGSLSYTVTLNQAGVYDLTLTTASGQTFTQSVTAVTPSTGGAAGGGQLSSTGTDVLPIALGAGAVLLLGTGTVLLVRKRREAA